MASELDKIKSTITVSLGLKNRIRTLKGSASYEEFLAQMLRLKNDVALGSNYVELQKFQRKEIVYSFDDYKVVFTYNKYNQSPQYIFDIQINTIRENGQKVLTVDFSLKNKSESLVFGYKLYFELLTLAIQNEIESMFKHKGRFEDYYRWEKEFQQLGLSKKAFENDVLEKLNDYEHGVQYK